MSRGAYQRRFTKPQETKPMIWDFHIADNADPPHVRIEAVLRDEVVALIVELPISCAYEAEAICNAHNKERH